MNNSCPQNPQGQPRQKKVKYVDDGVITYDGTANATRKQAFTVLAVCGALAISGVVYFKENSAPSYTPEQVEEAKPKKNEIRSSEISLMGKYGGQMYNIQRLPGMPEKHPKAKGNVYVRIPEKTPQRRLLIYLHGNGDQALKDDGSTGNMVHCAKELGLPLIAPQDGWGNKHPEKGGKLPGNWEDFNNVHFLSTLVRFAESQMGHSANQLMLGSFSGGNIAVVKILRSLEKSDESEARDLYKRISHIAFFDSADGNERDYVARWMDANSDARVYSCFNENAGGVTGQVYNGNKLYKSGNDLLQKALESKKISSSRFHIEQIPKKHSMGHGVRLDKCEEYLKGE